VLIPVDLDYSKGYETGQDTLSNRYLSLCIWVPHEEERDFIKIRPSYYPVREDWNKTYDVYLEWTEQHERLSPPSISAKSDISARSDIIQEILYELGPNFEQEIERTKEVLRRKLKEEFPPRYCLLLEMLSASIGADASMSVEEKLLAISISIFGD
jgi:hypothetical protein